MYVQCTIFAKHLHAFFVQQSMTIKISLGYKSKASKTCTNRHITQFNTVILGRA